MAITIRELTELPHLRTWLHAGAGGADREVTWAHVCELAEPWEWLSGGELVMTTGLGVPSAPDAQRAYVARLAAVGAAGLTIAERLHSPPLTAEMVEAANALPFPILFTGYEVPFIALERVVADASRGESQRLLARTVRLYDTSRAAAAEGLSGAALVARLADTVGYRAFVVDPRRMRTLLPGGAEPPPGLVSAVAAAGSDRATPFPAYLRVQDGDEHGIALPIPVRRPAVLLAVADRRMSPEIPVLQHVATIAALELERVASDRERERRTGAGLLAGLLERRVAEEASLRELQERRITRPFAIVASELPADPTEDAELHHRLGDVGVPALLLDRASVLLALVSDEPRIPEALLAELGPGGRIGVSEPFASPTQAPDAARQARWALEASRGSDAGLVRYGDQALTPFLPRTLDEARAAVDRVLGPLREYDAAHSTALLASTRVFLAENRSWQRAAAQLEVHKQTLVYRMRRVEELTGRRLDRTEDVAELWLAIRTAEAAGDTLVAVDLKHPESA